MSAPSPERAEKRRRVLRVLDEHGVDAVLLQSQPAVSWYLDGARVHVSLAGPPVVAVLVHRDGDELVTPANESARLVAEELPAGLRRHEVPWHGSLTAPEDWWPGARALAVASEDRVAAPLRAARASLLPGEALRYEQLCRDAAAVLTDALARATPRTTERELAAELTAGLVRVGAEPLVVLCSGADRLLHRHPLPTTGPLGRRVMAVVCGRRGGLIANVTRWVRFGPADPAEADAHARIAEVEADVLDALRPGLPLADLLPVVRGAYPRHGFGAEEWTRHHQGGPAGYAGRDPRLAPGVPDLVHEHQAFTWNPSAPGTKIEDTVLLGPDGVRTLSVDPRWPVQRVRGRDRPAELER
ncbi:M24 family metallopeptidase [Kocuria sp. M1N1S27]|uniref:M24 family metallopeptidase n=1 Tax=Kocuria kalidii TaxID=3376283 RepID=UPI0037960D0C